MMVSFLLGTSSTVCIESPESVDSFPDTACTDFFRWIFSFCMQTFAKWFSLPHLLQRLPNARHSSSLRWCVVPQYLHRIWFDPPSRLSSPTRPLSRLPAPVLLFTKALISASLVALSALIFFTCCFVFSLLRHISINGFG